MPISSFAQSLLAGISGSSNSKISTTTTTTTSASLLTSPTETLTTSKSSITSITSASVTERAADYINDIKNKIGKRNAIRHNKVANIVGHKFVTTVLSELTYCSQCDEFIWGLIGHKCKLCNLISHNKCLKLIDFKCNKQDEEQVDLSTLQISETTPQIISSHKFEETRFIAPTYCHHCGTFIKGFGIGGLDFECSLRKGGCSFKCHRECKDNVDPRCRLDANKRQVATRSRDCRSNDTTSKKSHNWSNRLQIQDFELMQLLGVGTFSKVYLARLKSNNRQFAIKVLEKTNLIMRSDPESAFTERDILKIGRQCLFLVTAHCCFQSRDRLFFVMEYVEGKDLVYHLQKAGRFSLARTRFHSAEIVLAIKFLHDLGFVHRDLKLDNIILNIHGHCKLLDFGLSKDLKKTANMKTRTFLGTPWYISPEIIKEQEYGFSVDWWSLGVLMFEMLYGRSPFDHEDAQSNPELLYQSIVRDEVQFPKLYSSHEVNKAESIIRGLLTKDPRQRLGCQIMEGGVQAIMEHPFFDYNHEDWADIDSQDVRLMPVEVKESRLDETWDADVGDTALTSNSANNIEVVDKISQKDFEGFSYHSGSLNSMIQK